MRVRDVISKMQTPSIRIDFVYCGWGRRFMMRKRHQEKYYTAEMIMVGFHYKHIHFSIFDWCCWCWALPPSPFLSANIAIVHLRSIDWNRNADLDFHKSTLSTFKPNGFEAFAKSNEKCVQFSSLFSPTRIMYRMRSLHTYSSASVHRLHFSISSK